MTARPFHLIYLYQVKKSIKTEQTEAIKNIKLFFLHKSTQANTTGTWKQAAQLSSPSCSISLVYPKKAITNVHSKTCKQYFRWNSAITIIQPPCNQIYLCTLRCHFKDSNPNFSHNTMVHDDAHYTSLIPPLPHPKIFIYVQTCHV